MYNIIDTEWWSVFVVSGVETTESPTPDFTKSNNDTHCGTTIVWLDQANERFLSLIKDFTNQQNKHYVKNKTSYN